MWPLSPCRGSGAKLTREASGTCGPSGEQGLGAMEGWTRRPHPTLCLLPLALNLLGNVCSQSLPSRPDACGALTVETMSI